MLKGSETSILFSTARAGTNGSGVISNRLTVPIRAGDDTLLEIAVADVNFFNEFVNITSGNNELQFTIYYSAGPDPSAENGVAWSLGIVLELPPDTYTHAEVIQKLNENIVTLFATAEWSSLWVPGSVKTSARVAGVGYLIMNLPQTDFPTDLIQAFEFEDTTLLGAGKDYFMAIPRFEAQTKHTVLVLSAPSEQVRFKSPSEGSASNMISMIPHTLELKSTPLLHKLGFSQAGSYPLLQFASGTPTAQRGEWKVVAATANSVRYVVWDPNDAIVSGDYSVRSKAQHKLTGRHLRVAVEQTLGGQTGVGFLNGYQPGVVLSLPLVEPSDLGSSQLNYGVRNRVYFPIGTRIDELTCAFYIDELRYEPDPQYPIIVEFNVRAVAAPETHKDEDTLPPIPGFRGVSSSIDPLVVHRKRRKAQEYN